MISFFPSLTRTRIVNSGGRRLGSTIVLLLVGIALLGSPSAQAQSTTQTLSLDAGWNLVSLRVQPEDASLDALFGSNVEPFHMVKDMEGNTYIPSEDIEQLTTWAVDEGYMVYVESAVDLDVSGTVVSADPTPIVLEEGGNFVPYFASVPQPVEDAFRSIETSLVRVESGSGEVYEPGASSPTLDSLRPSQGYKVYVDQRDTLEYPIVVPTLAEAKSLEGIEVGTTIQVQGYDEPGDGGGGIFEVTDSGTETDGGTVFVFDEDKSQEVTETFQEKTWNLVTFANDDLVWGSFSAQYGGDPEDEIGIEHLHGHNTKAKGSSSTYVDLKNGTFGNTGAAFKSLTDLGHGDDTWEYTYQYATSDRRLERKNVGNSVNLAWWGAPKADPANPQTADPLLKWAINAAARIFQNNNYEWTYVDIEGEYYYLHSTHIRDGVKLRGTGDVISQEWNTKGALTLMPDMALYYRKKSYDETAPENRDLYHGAMEQRKRHTFLNEYNALKIGYENLKIDGNLDGNMQVFNNLGDYNAPESHLQNSGTWAGFYSTGKGGQSFPDGMLVRLDDADIAGMGNLTMGLSSGDANFQTSNFHAKDGVRNHILYAPTGSALNDITAEGQFWGAALVLSDSRTSGEETYNNLTVKDLEEDLYGYDAILQDRSGDLTLDGFTVDIKDLEASDYSTPFDLFSVSNYGSIVKNGSFSAILPENYESNRPEQSAPALIGQRYLSSGIPVKDDPNVYENITVIDNGQPVKLHGGNPELRNSVFKDVVVELAEGAGGPVETPAIEYGLADPNPDVPRAYRMFYENVKYHREYIKRGVFSLSDKTLSGSEAHPYDAYWVGGLINAQPEFDKFVDGDDYDAFRAFLNDVTLNTQSGSGWHSDMRPKNAVRLRNAQDNSGRTSDRVNQSYTATSDDEINGYVLIPTSLMSRAWQTDVTANAGYNVTGVEIANSDGTLRDDDNTDQQDPYLKVSVDGSVTQGDTFNWTARITPLGEYSTTGLFVARAVGDKNLTTGNGPWQLDLRGVASSQESRDEIAYTASSGDTSVVSANVRSDDYTLELTEQDTGTATVTVTGSIDGVGSTTDTFEVSIE